MVRYNVVAQWLEELRRDEADGLVDRRIVRVSRSYRLVGPETEVSVWASYSVECEVIALRVVCGLYMIENTQHVQKAAANADDILARIGGVVAELGLDRRGGLYFG